MYAVEASFLLDIEDRVQNFEAEKLVAEFLGNLLVEDLIFF